MPLRLRCSGVYYITHENFTRIVPNTQIPCSALYRKIRDAHQSVTEYATERYKRSGTHMRVLNEKYDMEATKYLENHRSKWILSHSLSHFLCSTLNSSKIYDLLVSLLLLYFTACDIDTMLTKATLEIKDSWK